MTQAATLQAIRADLPKWSRLEIATLLTLMTLLLYGSEHFYIKVPLSTLTIAAVIMPPLRTSRTFWLVLSLLTSGAVYFNWYEVDNHKYLLAYWCIAICCALHTREPEKGLARSARLLVGLCFAFALVWKFRSSDFLDGSFFQHCFLFDPRFRTVALYLGGIDDAMRTANRDAFASLAAWDSRLTEAAITSTPAIATLSQVLVVWTLFIEAWVAIAFLVPTEKWLARWRHLPLLLFIASTYAVAPVLGFGSMLTAMGSVQCEGDSQEGRRWRIGYIGVFLLLQIFTIPWRRLLQGIQTFGV